MKDIVKEFSPTWIDSIKITHDGDQDVVSLSIEIPIEGLHSLVTLEEEFSLGDKNHSNIQKAVKNLYAEIVKNIRSKNHIKNNKCINCSSPCCYHWHNDILVTKEDVERICKSLNIKNPSEYFDQSYAGCPDSRYVGKTRYQKDQYGSDVCIFFDHTYLRCSIHEVKPQICQEYKSHSCGLFEKTSNDIIQLRRKQSSDR